MGCSQYFFFCIAYNFNLLTVSNSDLTCSLSQSKSLEMTDIVTPGDVLGNVSEFKAGKGAYVNDKTIYASLTGSRRIVSSLPDSPDQVSLCCIASWDMLFDQCKCSF